MIHLLPKVLNTHPKSVVIGNPKKRVSVVFLAILAVFLFFALGVFECVIVPRRFSETNVKPIRFRHIVIDNQGPANPHIKVLGDINSDGFVDIVVASSNGGPIVWYEYPNWTKHVIAPSGWWSTDAKLADMDVDGDLDIIISDEYGNRIEWYENPQPEADPATENWKLHLIGNPRAHNIKVGDIDMDGCLEIVTRVQGKEGNTIVVWKKYTDDLWTKRLIDCPDGEGLAIGDINRDGRSDIVIGGRWFEAPRYILTEHWIEHFFADWPQDSVVELGDMNNDGLLDVVLTRSEGNYKLSWFEAPVDPNGNWTEKVIDDSVDFAHSLVICDMNIDGHLDIATAEMHQSERKRIMIYLNEGNAIEWNMQVIAVTGSHNLCVADIGNDGTLDIVGANWSGDYQPIELWEQILAP